MHHFGVKHKAQNGAYERLDVRLIHKQALQTCHLLLFPDLRLKTDKINTYSIRESQGPQWGWWRPQTEYSLEAQKSLLALSLQV